MTTRDEYGPSVEGPEDETPRDPLSDLLALLPDPDDYWYIEDRAHGNERGEGLRFVIDRRPVEKAAGRRLYVNEQADQWATAVIEAARALASSTQDALDDHKMAPFVLEGMLELQRLRGRLSKVTVEDVALLLHLAARGQQT